MLTLGKHEEQGTHRDQANGELVHEEHCVSIKGSEGNPQWKLDCECVLFTTLADSGIQRNMT